jgi:hypothetical protein
MIISKKGNYFFNFSDKFSLGWFLHNNFIKKHNDLENTQFSVTTAVSSTVFNC